MGTEGLVLVNSDIEKAKVWIEGIKKHGCDVSLLIKCKDPNINLITPCAICEFINEEIGGMIDDVIKNAMLRMVSQKSKQGATRTIYTIMGDTGENDDTIEWVVRSFYDKGVANQYLEALRLEVKRLEECYSKHCVSKHAYENRLDSNFVYYINRPTMYYILETELDISSDI